MIYYTKTPGMIYSAECLQWVTTALTGVAQLPGREQGEVGERTTARCLQMHVDGMM